MEFNPERKTNTAYIKTIDLQLNGNQINLAERPKSKEQFSIRKKLARSLRPCTLRRPWSATPSFGYREMSRNKRLPPWSRPQSAGGCSSTRRHKLAAKFSDSTLNDPDYMPEFGATYTLSSSQILQSLMGSCSINEGLDSDTTPTPSPQPSLGDTIRAAAQLEPGLTAKPPLPPSTTPQPRPESVSTDEIIALKFQRWFPESVLESEVVKRTSLTVNPFENNKDEADNSDAGTSLTDGTELSDRENDRPTSSNISTFVKKKKTSKNTKEDKEKSILKSSKNQLNTSEQTAEGKKSPKIVILEPDPYGFDIVTEEFSSERNVRSLSSDYTKTLNKSINKTKGNNFKRLSLSDLNVKSSTSTVVRSNSVQIHSDSEEFKDDYIDKHDHSFQGYYEGLSDSELFNNKSEEIKNIYKENEILSPVNFETSASKFRFTSTPIGMENNSNSSRCNSKNSNMEQVQVNNNDVNSKINSNNKLKCEESSKTQQNDVYKRFSPPIKLRSEDDAVYHDHFDSKTTLEDLKQSLNTEKGEINERKSETKYNQKKYELDKQEKHAHFLDDQIRNNQLKLKENIENMTSDDKNYDYWPQPCTSTEKRLSYSVKEKRDSKVSMKNSTKHGSLENVNRDIRKTNKPNKEISRAASVPPFRNSRLSVNSKHNSPSKVTNSNSENSKKKTKRSMSYDSAASHVS